MQASSSWPQNDYFEMIDKSAFANATNDEILMRWNRVDAYCGAQAKQYALDRGYRVSLSQVRNTYMNCMAANNFRLLDPENYHDVARSNRAKYGASFVIEKTWPQ